MYPVMVAIIPPPRYTLWEAFLTMIMVVIDVSELLIGIIILECVYSCSQTVELAQAGEYVIFDFPLSLHAL
jgi:hypothetical protein